MEVNKITTDEAIVKLEKSLDLTNSNDLKKILLELSDQGVTRICLDFQDTASIDSSGLGKILFFSEFFQHRSGFLKIVNVQCRELQELLKLIQLEKIVSIEYK